MALSFAQLQQFKIDGYLVLPGLLSETECDSLRALTTEHLEQRIAPFELEASVQYPGAPASESSQGGQTIRRIQGAYARDHLFERYAQHPEVVSGIKQILDCATLWLNPNHHNCVMTKQAKFSSETLWHRDTRYWNFSNKYLINTWFALGQELKDNGAMKILPGSHRWEVRDQALDQAQFLRPEHPDNVYRLRTARTVELEQGDVLLFSAHCFHAAGRNTTNNSKYSIVFTYHGPDTQPVANTNSAKAAEIRVDI